MIACSFLTNIGFIAIGMGVASLIIVDARGGKRW